MIKKKPQTLKTRFIMYVLDLFSYVFYIISETSVHCPLYHMQLSDAETMKCLCMLPKYSSCTSQYGSYLLNSESHHKSPVVCGKGSKLLQELREIYILKNDQNLYLFWHVICMSNCRPTTDTLIKYFITISDRSALKAHIRYKKRRDGKKKISPLNRIPSQIHCVVALSTIFHPWYISVGTLKLQEQSR